MCFIKASYLSGGRGRSQEKSNKKNLKKENPSWRGEIWEWEGESLPRWERYLPCQKKRHCQRALI